MNSVNRNAMLIWIVCSSIAQAAHAQVGRNTDVLDANLAAAAELSALPRLDQELAAAIIDQRPFSSITALDQLLSPALSAAERSEVYGRLFIPIDLNTASREEMLLIPGMSDRMAHEFEEYRPYTSLEQFRREIGKYVDAAEVARLEQYVFVPLDLNSATREDFLTIPGVGERMVREFLEYRPYRSMEQFRREIGKYVSGDEVARLERYMTIR
jgi:DNA uptake protein ComE-like DNA-binding protein